jgi:hypothetical protein
VRLETIATLQTTELPAPNSPLTYRLWSGQIASLATSVRALEPLAAELDLPPCHTLAWHCELFQKLLPQVQQEPFLIVAVAGGTNTGKSTVFNHLAGSQVSRSHPNATQTRHPVCLVPHDFASRDELAASFPEFELRNWTIEDDPLDERDDNLLFLRDDPSGQQPPRLLLLDTPDIDGTLKRNWHRADLIRYAADVLVCILTQQKYNDAAIREFFRAAAEAEKTVIVVFNMVHWPRQQELCCGWLAHFAQETGVQPAAVYAVPWDPDRAEQQTLPFYPLSSGATDLKDDLAELQFDAIKIRSLEGSLRRVLHEQTGLPAFLARMDRRSKEFAGARDLLDHDIREQPIELPDLPRQLVWQEIWNWLEGRRTRFDRWIHGAYNKLGDLVTRWWRENPEEALESFRRAEFDRLQMALASQLDQLDRLRRGGNSILTGELDNVLGGLNRTQLFDELKLRHRSTPLVTEGYREFIRQQLDAFEEQNPALLKGVSWALVATAVVRPAISVGLAVVGAHGMELAAGHWAISWVGDVAVGTATAAAGEAVTVPTGQFALKTLLSGLFARFYEERVKLLTKTLDDLVLGPVVERLNRLSHVRDDLLKQRTDRLVKSLRITTNVTQPQNPQP